MDYQFRFDIVWSNFDVLMAGLRITIMLSVYAMALGVIIGITTAVIRLRRLPLLSQLIVAYVEVFRGTPALIQIVWIYYVLPIILGINLSALASLVLAMALNSGAYLSEVFRTGIQGVDKGHIDAARALGFTGGGVTRRIVLPQAIYRMIPTIGNVFISSIKMSSLASVLAMSELMYQGQLLIANHFRPIEVYSVVAVIYFCLTYSTSMILIYMERRFAWVKRDKRGFWSHLRARTAMFKLAPE